MPPTTSRRREIDARALGWSLDKSDPLPLQRQLYDQIRQAILSGRLLSGVRFPSTRTLAGELFCARNTVLGAYDQLIAEGYAESRPGSGTYVAQLSPEHLLQVGQDRAGPRSESPPGPSEVFSKRGKKLIELGKSRISGFGAFRMGAPDCGEFPFDVWARFLAQCWRNPTHHLVRPGDPAGYFPLRRAIAAYVRSVRSVLCEPEQVIITNGAQQSLDLILRALLNPGDKVLLEDPGYQGLRGPLRAAGAIAVPCPLDNEGFDLTAALTLAPEARMALVTPSHQYPLGTVMSLARRLAIIDWVRASNSWIVEDDYDSEYRYAGRPLASMQGLEGGQRTFYMGSFSKVLFPSIRLGYLIVPAGLAEPFAALRASLDDHPSAVVQPVLARFIEEGYFAAHIRRMRKLYEERQKALVTLGREKLRGLLELEPDQAGLHLVAPLAPELALRMDDQEAARRAEARGLIVHPLSRFYAQAPARQALLLGYAAIPARAMATPVERLSEALKLA